MDTLAGVAATVYVSNDNEDLAELANGKDQSGTASESRETGCPRYWQQWEDEILRRLVKANGAKRWKKVAESIPGRSSVQCSQRWRRIIKTEHGTIPPRKDLLRRAPRHWSVEEDNALITSVKVHNAKNWKLISKSVPGRSNIQCQHRWRNVLAPGHVKGKWSRQEDLSLISLIRKYMGKGSGSTNVWRIIAMNIEGRTQKQCRERWYNHLDPSIKVGHWSVPEDRLLLELQNKHGKKWSVISEMMKGRTQNAVKVRWNILQRKINIQKMD